MKQNYRKLFKAKLSRELHAVFPYYNKKRGYLPFEVNLFSI